MNFRTSRALAAVLAAGALAVPSAHATAQPADWANPNVEGSTVDVTNIRNTLLSDATGLTVSVHPNGCALVLERPQLQPSATSPTGMMVKAQGTVACALLGSATNSFRLQQSRWTGWLTLSSQAVATYPQGFSTVPVVTNCRAGTWSYRIQSVGTHNVHSQSARFTCVDKTDLFRIDPN